MSFRTRLTLFFVLIVIVPMISVAVVLFRLISDNEGAKADAPLATRVQVVANLYNFAVLRADGVLRRVAVDRGLATALARGDRAVLTRRARRLSGVFGAVRVVVVRGRRVIVDVGEHSAVAPAARRLSGTDGRMLGEIEVSALGARDFVKQARSIVADSRGESRFEIAVTRHLRSLASTLPGTRPAELARLGHITVGGRGYRVASVDLPGFRGVPLRVSVISDQRVSANVASAQRLAGAILAGFLLLALACAFLVSRALQQQIARFLEAARRLGGGDFSSKVPVDGRDEFSALGEEFNKMSTQLEGRLAELREQRGRLEGSLRRIGETFASNLDGDALLRIVLSTAVDGVNAQVGRAMTRSDPQADLEEAVRIGEEAALYELLARTEADVDQAGEPRETEGNGGFGLGHPLLGEDAGTESEPPAVMGTICVARTTAFSPRERDLFHYLAAQAAISIENVALHETVQRQAATDELTGLYNLRRFQEALAQEVERSKRFDQGMGLVMVDIDNFKQVNDTHGHQQGDMVLREVARTVREFSREIDSPARYGGEELAVVLPQTDLEGTYNLAERVRTGIEELELPLLDGSGTMSVTASLGVAALPDSGSEPRELVAAADAALYEAKRSGKNRTVRAQ